MLIIWHLQSTRIHIGPSKQQLPKHLHALVTRIRLPRVSTIALAHSPILLQQAGFHQKLVLSSPIPSGPLISIIRLTSIFFYVPVSDRRCLHPPKVEVGSGSDILSLIRVMFHSWYLRFTFRSSIYCGIDCPTTVNYLNMPSKANSPFDFQRRSRWS